MPGADAWRTGLGRFWTHDYAERIVIDNPGEGIGHVWLLTRHGGFHEFSNLATGSGLRLYQSRKPTDEFRSLYYDTATATWRLQSLDGSVEFFRTDGQWDKTVRAQDPSHPTQSTYNAGGQLVTITFPDGHSDSLTYYPGGKLEKLIQVAVPGTGTPSREWIFNWNGDELDTATRPDGSIYDFTYDPTRPGYLIATELVSGSDRRVVAAFSYLAGTNRVRRSWRGALTFDHGDAVDQVTYQYDDPDEPTQTMVTRKVTGAFDRVTTFHFESPESSNGKPRVTSFTGTCPTCGLSPTMSFDYPDADSLLPESMTDAKGTRTDYTYTATGRLHTKTEAANVPGLARTSTYAYDTNFSGLLKSVEVPSTSACASPRRTETTYDAATGRIVSGMIDGCEGGAALPVDFMTTNYTTNGSGEILTIDPPGFSSADLTTLTYNLPGRNGHVVDSRTDPLVGTTSFGYDGLNRRRSVTDVNGVQTLTEYDSMNRVIEVRKLGAVAAEDLVTSFIYNGFGDLFCIRLPRGNGIEHGYDAAGRLTTTTRGIVVGTPTSTQCIDAAQPRERAVYGLDFAGNRTEEKLEPWTGSSWVTESRTTYDHTCHLDKTTQGAGSANTSVTEYCYDLNDNLEKVWDANHPKVTYPNPTHLYEYDELNRLKKLTVGVGTANAAPTTYTYDVQDHLASVTDAEGNETTYTTSDRDLLTQQVSPSASGTTNYQFNAHGQLWKTTDARAMVAERSLDAADRVTQETFGPAGSPDPALTTIYGYGSNPAEFNVGRLTTVARNAYWVIYNYDRFRRLKTDGVFSYEYDKNGYRTRIQNNANRVRIAALYTPDFADRDSTLSYEVDFDLFPLVTSASYRASGPLASLTFASGLTETRTFDTRYYPKRIQAGALLDWNYTVDGIGNPNSITGSLDGSLYVASFAYQDGLYFLTQGNGPWGNRAWTYDKIGNRLTSSGTGEPNLIYYPQGGHGPRLAAVAPAPGFSASSWTYTYDAAGYQTSIRETPVAGDEVTIFHDVSAEGRLAALRLDGEPDRTDFWYDGRGFLVRAAKYVPGAELDVTPLYDSHGRLLEVQEEGDSTFAMTDVFYFAGRPVGVLTDEKGLWSVTTDHLGTPLLTTGEGGEVITADSIEPFRVNGKLSLQYLGQWWSAAFNLGKELQTELFYNVNRWYQPALGRYSAPDPIGLEDGPNPYLYAGQRPVRFIDPLGLEIFICTRKAEWLWGALNVGNHSYFWNPGGPPFYCGKGNATEGGPWYDECRPVPGSDGQEGELMRCCASNSSSRPWWPNMWDCHDVLQMCQLIHLQPGFAPAPSPGGRFGPPCDRCPRQPPPPPRGRTTIH